MQDVLIFGTNDFAEILYRNIEMQSKKCYRVVGFMVDDDYYTDDTCLELPVYRYSETDRLLVRTAFICVGYTGMNQNREQIFYRLQQDGWNLPNYIDETAVVRSKVMGKANIILEGAIISTQASIGHGNIFYPHSNLAHHSVLGDFNYLSIAATISGHVTVGNNCFFGANSTTKDKIDIHDRSLIGAGCYLNASTNHPDGVYVPPRKIELQKKSSEINL